MTSPPRNEKRLSDCLSRTELREISRTTNWQGGAMLGGDILLLAAAFALSILWPNSLTVAVSILLIAGRQLAFAIVMHDCAHNALFRTKALNALVGNWIGGAAVDVPLALYRDYHLDHHRHAGTAADPDLGLVRAYPVTRDSLRRKFLRDLTGRTALRGRQRRPSDPLSAQAFRAFHKGRSQKLAFYSKLGCCRALNDRLPSVREALHLSATSTEWETIP